MAIIQFHTPQGIVPVDSDTVTNEELVALGVTREAMEALIPKKPIECVPGSFNPPETGIPEKLNYIIEFMKKLCE